MHIAAPRRYVRVPPGQRMYIVNQEQISKKWCKMWWFGVVDGVVSEHQKPKSPCGSKKNWISANIAVAYEMKNNR